MSREFRCVHCNLRLTVQEFLWGYCVGSDNSFHHSGRLVDVKALKKELRPDNHLGGVGGE